MKKLFILNIIFTLILSACSDDKENKKSTSKDKTKEVIAQKHYAPLSGKEIKVENDNRVIAVMINNHSKARPQSGLVKADIVYELLAEGDVTRLLAIYQSEYPIIVGPVRSARSYYIELASAFNALYICHGNSPEAKTMLNQGIVDNLNGQQYDGVYFKRDRSRFAPHNSYTGIDLIKQGANKRNYSLEGAPDSLNFNYEEIPFDSAWTLGEIVKINYSYMDSYDVSYSFDKTKNAYARYQGSVQTSDREDGLVYVDNLIMIISKHSVIDSSGRRDIDLTSGGDAVIFQQGMQKKVQWQSNNGIITLFDNGIELPLVPGKTWVNFIPNETYLIK